MATSFGDVDAAPFSHQLRIDKVDAHFGDIGVRSTLEKFTHAQLQSIQKADP